MRHDECGLLHLLDHGSDRKGLACACGAEQHLMLESFVYAVHKSADGFGLVAHGNEGCLKFEIHSLFFGWL